MSELNSLYVSVEIKKDRLEEFFKEKPVKLEPDQDLATWWDSRKMYSPSPLTDIPHYGGYETNRAVFESLLKDPQTGTKQEDKEGVFSFSVVFFSENYFEILPMLSWLKTLAGYLSPEQKGVALIYDYFWGSGDVMAHLEFNGPNASLTTVDSFKKINKELQNTVSSTLKNVVDVMMAQYGNEED